MKCFKKMYTTRHYAKIKKRYYRNKFGTKYDIYLCPICSGYHLTTNISVSPKEFFRKNKEKGLDFSRELEKDGVISKEVLRDVYFHQFIK